MSLLGKFISKIQNKSNEASDVKEKEVDTLYAIPIGAQEELPKENINTNNENENGKKETKSLLKRASESSAKIKAVTKEDLSESKKIKITTKKEKALSEDNTTKKTKALTKEKITSITKEKIAAISKKEVALTQEELENKKKETTARLQAITNTARERAMQEVDLLKTAPKIPAVESEGPDLSGFDQISSKPKYSLQLKLMLVISVIIAITVSTIIALATISFKNDNMVRIQENNLEIVRIVNSKVITDITAEIDKGKQLALTLKQEFKFAEQKTFFINQYFKNDDSFIFLGVYSKGEDGTLKPINEIYNKEYLKKVALAEEDVIIPVNKNHSLFYKSFDGTPVIINTSPGFQDPSLCISVPENEGEPSELVLVMMLRVEKILDAFKKSGINTTYLVSGDGTLLAHPDLNLVLSAKNMMTSPIVRYMLTNEAKNGLNSYQDSDGKKYIGSFQKLGFANAGVISYVEEGVAFKPVYRIQERNIYIMIIALCISMILVFLFAKTISSPLLALLDETIKIAKGIFQVNLRRTTNDEVGVLTDYFKTMAQGLEEREKVKSMLGSMIDPVVVEEGMKDLAALKRGDEKIITAFFSDVAGFSTISEQLTSVQLASLLNEYLSAMTIILKKHDGVLDKYIGDAIVGIFGAPVEVKSHFLKASYASLEMIQKLDDLRDYWQKNNLYSKEAQEMDVRIGLNTGLAKVGFMGTDAMGSYTMMGDTVNLAARLEAAGKDYGVNILISEMVKEKVQDDMFTRELDLVRVKGKNEPVRLYELISTKADVKPNIKEATEIYEKAFELYLEREWEKSIILLKDSEKAKGKKDKAVRSLIERCDEYLKNPPDETWDGVFTRTHK